MAESKSGFCYVLLLLQIQRDLPLDPSATYHYAVRLWPRGRCEH